MEKNNYRLTIGRYKWTPSDTPVMLSAQLIQTQNVLECNMWRDLSERNPRLMRVVRIAYSENADTPILDEEKTYLT